MYGLPESPDTFTDVICEITKEAGWDSVMKQRVNMLKNSSKTVDEDTIVEETQKLRREQKTVQMGGKSVVGLFSKYDGLQLERIVGSENYKKMLNTEAKDSFTIASIK